MLPLVPPFPSYAAPMVTEIERMRLDVRFLVDGHGFPVDFPTAVERIASAGPTT